LNGASASSMGEVDVKVSRSAKNWQVEMALPMNMLNPVQQPISISRYARTKKADAKDPNAFETVCSTLMPVSDIGGTVGGGNHPACMAFVWGPLLVCQGHDAEVKASK
ncbi:MAG: hypothetical protein WCP55_25750, partial [Lentisphaerota bacterium]